MSLGTRDKLFLGTFAFIAAAAVAADASVIPSVERHIAAVFAEDLTFRARLVARAASLPSPSPTEAPDWDAFARSLAAEAGARVAVVGIDGVLLADSELSASDVANAENQLFLPEVRNALTGGTPGEGAAHTATRGSPPNVSVAVPFDRGGRREGVVCVSGPVAGIDAATADVRRSLWFGAGLAAILLFGLCSLAAQRFADAARSLTRVVRRMSEGDLSVRTHLRGSDEFAELGQTLDRWAVGLARTLGELRGERDLQKKILEAMHEGVVVVDSNGRIALVNPALRSMLLLGADAVGKLLIETVRHAQLHTMLDRARAASGDQPVEIDLPGLKPRRVLVQVASLSGGNGSDEGHLFVFVDVTELRRLESLRRDFVANASHELRTPIAAVRSATETLQSGALDDRSAATRFLDIIERNAQRLQSLVEDMLELSKLESNEFKLKKERVELQRVVPIVLALFRERADKKGVRLSSDLPVTLPPVEGDSRAVEHILSNLVDNAVKYCPSGSQILVGATSDEQRVRLVVADTGGGIAPEHLSRVFERFYRIDAGRSRELGGTGLGLSIVKHMVEAMRGRVSVESGIGRGSTFSVNLHRADLPGSVVAGASGAFGTAVGYSSSSRIATRGIVG